jgi:rhamnogalacturonan acetylesterase
MGTRPILLLRLVWTSPLSQSPGATQFSNYHVYSLFRLTVSQLGGPVKGAYFVPHGQYCAQAMKNLGAVTVNANYPNDHTHTAPYLADVMARAFVLGLKCGTSALGQVAKNSTASLTGTFLVGCVNGFNSTVTNLLR